MTWRLLLFAVASAVATAQSSSPSFSQIRLGYVFSKAQRSLIPIIGIPGASYLGLPAVGDLEIASVAPNGRHAIGVFQDRAGYSTDLQRDAELRSSLSGLIQEISDVSWSADSTVAILYSASRGAIQRVVDWPRGVRAEPPVEIGEVAVPVRALAASPTGSRFVVVAADGKMFLGEDGNPLRQLRAGTAADRACFLAPDELLLTAPADRGIFTVRVGAGDEVASEIWPLPDGVGPPRAVGCSLQDGYALVAASEPPELLVFQSGRFTGRHSLDIHLDRIERFGRSGVWLAEGKFLENVQYTLIEGHEPLRTYFVPKAVAIP